MKIGIVCYPTFGGSGVVATELGKALALRGHQVHFITYSQPARLSFFTENLFYHEVYVPTYPLFQYPPYELALASKMVDIVRNQGLDVLHVHYAIPHASAAFMAKQILRAEGIQIPVVTTLHGTDITLVGKDASYEPVVTFSINQSDGVTAVSEYLRRETLAHFDVEREIEVIPNFIDTQRFRRLPKDHFRQAITPNGEALLVHVSNFRAVKRTADTVETLAQLRAEGVAVKLLLVGDGPDRVPTEHLARKLGVYEDIRFLGKQDPIEEILSIADVFLMPSGSETFGLAALEAMACEVPVVSSDQGGLPELVVDGETGFLCPIGDVEAYTRAVRRILDDPDLHARMARAARRRAADEFGLDRVIPRYEAHYEAVIARAREGVGA